ncbi:MAG TPA: TIGR02301 family protein [Bauldia sp.]|nr:TIGR02301 family protein [Bauldia sp.]
MTVRIMLAALLLIASLVTPSLHQAPSAQEAGDTEPPAPTVAPYDGRLVRLSEILGSVHYLRELCGAREGTLWRDQMQGLIDAEQAQGERLARLVDGFNRGYEGFKAVYRACTPAATTAVDRYMEEGAKIARDIAARYGREE